MAGLRRASPFQGFPLIVGWELTLRCNLGCAHCGSSAGLPRRRELRLDEALGICNQLPSLLVREVDFTGGEPLLSPLLPAAAARLKDLGILAKVVTNGTLLAPSAIRMLVDSGIGYVGVSIDGLEPTHDSIRGSPGLFARSMDGIAGLKRAGVNVTAITTVNERNVGELAALGKRLEGAGVDTWQVQPVFPTGRAGGNAALALAEASYLAFGSFVARRYSSCETAGMQLSPGDSFGYYTEMDRRVPAWGGCSAGIIACGITSDGKVKGCLSMPDELIEGDLRIRDLWDIWFDPASFRYNRQIDVDDFGVNCKGCRKAAECGGGCQSMSYSSTGTMHNDPYCLTRLEASKRVADKKTAPIRSGFPYPAGS